MQSLLETSYRVVRTIVSEIRYKEMEIIFEANKQKAILYIYKLSEKQDFEIAWNDFYLTVDMLKKSESIGLMSLLQYGYNKESNEFYIVQETQDYDMNWDEYLTEQMILADDVTKFRLWLEMVKSISALHGLSLHNGNIEGTTTLLKTAPQGVSFRFPSLLSWRLNQIFLLEKNNQELYLSPISKHRSYRNQHDDHFSLGVMLFQVLFPKKKVPANYDELMEYHHLDSDLINILYNLLFPEEEISLSLIREMGEKYLTKQLDGVILSVCWDKEVSKHFLENEMTSIKDFENRFFLDTEKDTYLFTSYKHDLKQQILHVVGLTKEWELVIPSTKSAVKNDLMMCRCTELTPFEREKLKEKGKLFKGTWSFQHFGSPRGKEFLQSIKNESISKQTERRKRLKTREAFDSWDEVLGLQISHLADDDKRYAFKQWEVVENGRYIEIELMSMNSIQVSFEVGTEILFSSGEMEYKAGRFVKQEGPFIYLEVLRDVNLDYLPTLGDLYENQKHKSTLVKRQRRILQRFMHGDQVDKSIVNALIEPEKVSIDTVPLLKTYQELNDDQFSALKEALGANPLYLLQGPPGTGKTTWITELILQIYSREPNARILLSSQSNVAIDHAFSKVLKMMSMNKDAFKQLPVSVRIGNDNKISPSIEQWKFEHSLSKWVEELEENIHQNIWTIIDKVSHDTPKYERLMNLFEEWKQSIHKSDDLKPLFFSKSPLLVAATCMGSYPFYHWEQSFDWIIIDEAARATAPEILVPTLLGKKVIFVGDHKQLPPIVEDMMEQTTKATFDVKELEVSLFEDLFNRLLENNKSTLKTQYRMHSAISEIVSSLFYPETPLEVGLLDTVRKGIDGWKPLNWISIDGHPDANETEVGTSYLNSAEATIIQHLLLQLNEACEHSNKEKEVAIIAGYTPQRDRLRDAIHSLQLPALTIEIDTVDAFQGREADVVIYSMVRNNKQQRVGFLRDERRLNVMMSRAKEQLFIVGSADMVNRLSKKHILNQLYDRLTSHQHSSVIHWKEIVK